MFMANMKSKPHRAVQFLAACLTALFMVLMMATPVALADDVTLPEGLDRATENGATVSDEVDRANNTKPSMGTEYFMYLAPDPDVHDIPKMGDTGFNTRYLMLGALFVGAAFLVVQRYAYAGEKAQQA